ncbi:potassium channel family protein [Natronorubrum thiooxidans]|uniref:Voltage-gated potassium channel n=1 Tax=Natronorubrum thiooxidans TaxID=308853 RepID=A0A1N7F6N5_9EURY|nr:NAD(P)-binding protein [Natronorubrum thiooxidans]SIR95980.1 voltage-gated potassium channel [Natronorubrum thiooxidans]
MALDNVWHYFDRQILRRTLVPIGVFVVTVVAGVLGLSMLGNVGLVEATFWLVDLTSIDLHFEEHTGPERATKAYAILVTVGLILSGLWIGETVVTEAFGGRIQSEVSRATMHRRIENTDDHVIVCGYGMFGRTIANRLTEAGQTVVVIEIDETHAERVREDGHLLVTGDARREQVLRSAGVERATKLVAAIDDSNVNIQIAIVSGTATSSPDILVRVGKEMYEPVAREAGADDVIIPEVVSGERVTRLLEPERPAD